jgi:hypothetical protein
MKRPPDPVAIEYDSRNRRVRKVFTDAYAARRFYCLKDKQGKRPRVRKVI